MLVITRYLVGDYMAAIRLAEDMVYNSARVHGPRHPSTIEMTILLTRCTPASRRDTKTKRTAASWHTSTTARPLGCTRTPSAYSSIPPQLKSARVPPAVPNLNHPGKYVRQHLNLLKLAVERLGNWPKEYSEYERLCSELFSTFGR